MQFLLIFLGVSLVTLGLLKGGWWLPASWLGGNFLILGIAHLLGFHRVFGKRSNGTLPVWSRLVFLPLHTCTTLVWHLVRQFGRAPAYHVVNERLVVGRRLLEAERQLEFDNYVDLTAEFAEPPSIRGSSSYFSYPILDGAAPTPGTLHAAVTCLRPGRTFVHCAQGHGRTGLVALALLLSSGAVQDVEDGWRTLKAVRPGIRLNKAQRQCIEHFAKNFCTLR